MKRLQMRQRVFKGEITVFLSLIFVLLISLAGAMIQSASIHINKSMKRADTQLAMESVFAEYHQRLLREYDIFAKEGSDEQQISRRLWFYGAKNMKHKIQKIAYLSDNGGQAFYEQAISAMGGDVREIEYKENESFEEIEVDAVQGLEELLIKEGAENPVKTFEMIKSVGILNLVIEEPEKLSNRYIEEELLPSNRALQKGTMEIGQNKSGLTENLLFTAYLIEHFSNYQESYENRSLCYEVEYLLGGKQSDRQNLEVIVNKILSLRVVVNYVYLMSDEVRQAEAQAMAAILSSLMTTPGAAEIVKQALLVAWSYGESILDLRTLMHGKCVPAIKDDSTWQMQLSNLTKLGTEEDSGIGSEGQKGMSYTDYLSVLLFAAEKESLCMRALNLLEMNLGIRVDECVTGIRIKSTCELQRNITDIFLTEYQY